VNVTLSLPGRSPILVDMPEIPHVGDGIALPGAPGLRVKGRLWIQDQNGEWTVRLTLANRTS
jgi:hypothetical protein